MNLGLNLRPNPKAVGDMAALGVALAAFAFAPAPLCHRTAAPARMPAIVAADPVALSNEVLAGGAVLLLGGAAFAYKQKDTDAMPSPPPPPTTASKPAPPPKRAKSPSGSSWGLKSRRRKNAPHPKMGTMVRLSPRSADL